MLKVVARVVRGCKSWLRVPNNFYLLQKMSGNELELILRSGPKQLETNPFSMNEVQLQEYVRVPGREATKPQRFEAY